ncbi:TIGR04222 domain-containing membrane protein [Actinacidiphila sp. bgisy160]|uniref:TIGR04222 domain-containing membrane protein n=1 Tax=Actinacidiphila sp. bgisy160 TaxID=3413796 RepID=UPI003D7245F3
MAGTGLIVTAGALLRAPGTAAGEVTDPYEAAYLRDGRRGAVVVALVALHLRGTVDAGAHRTARISGPLQGLSHPLQLAVYEALYRPTGVNTVAVSRRVRRETDVLRERLTDAGLIRRDRRRRAARVLACAAVLTVAAGLVTGLPTGWEPPLRAAVSAVPVAAALALWAVPRRTRAGRQALRRAQERFPRPQSRRASPESVLLAVALHGDPALRLAVPHFTREAGLLARHDRTESLYGVNHWKSGGGGGCGSGGLSCGGAGGGV